MTVHPELELIVGNGIAANLEVTFNIAIDLSFVLHAQLELPFCLKFLRSYKLSIPMLFYPRKIKAFFSKKKGRKIDLGALASGIYCGSYCRFS